MNEFWKGKRVLITGGTGFLGKYLSDVLSEFGAQLRILDYRRPIEQANNIEFYEADIRHKDKIAGVCKGINTVFHLAAMPSIARGTSRDYYEVNIRGTFNVLSVAFENKVEKFVHVSSSTVYGIPQEFPLKETSPICPLGKYGRSKLEAENLCKEFIKKGMNVSIIRPRVIMGWGRIGIFSILFDCIKTNKPVYIIGNGTNIFQFTNVLDMAEACIKAAEYDKSDLFNIGSEEILPVRVELHNLIRYAKSKSPIVSIPRSLAVFSLKILSLLGLSPLIEEQFAIADKNFKLDTTHAYNSLGWKPKYSNFESLCQAYDWYLANISNKTAQYENILGVIGKFKHSKMGGFQR